MHTPPPNFLPCRFDGHGINNSNGDRIAKVMPAATYEDRKEHGEFIKTACNSYAVMLEALHNIRDCAEYEAHAIVREALATLGEG